jgi:aconitate hydratase
MKSGHKNSFGTHSTDLQLEGKTYHYHSLRKLAEKTGRDLSRLPRSLRVLLENLLRHEDGDIVRREDIEALLDWDPKSTSSYEIQFTPARVLLQDFTGVPVVADLAAMRTALERRGKDPTKVNPLQPVDLVIDHSFQVDAFGSTDAYRINAKYEFDRNGERYEFLKWGQKAFSNFQVVPPATGICHQVNLEFLAHVAMHSRHSGEDWAVMDTLVGTDSHTPMVNGLGVLGWGVGGIEAEAAMLGQPCSMLIPDVIGFELTGQLKAGVTATDLVLTITQILRKKGVVGKFVEFTGPGVHSLSIANRATISNMAPEYGATVGYWPVDQKTIEYLKLTGRNDRARLAQRYFELQDMWAEPGSPRPQFSDLLQLDLSTVETSLAGPSKPHDRSTLPGVVNSFKRFLKDQEAARGPSKPATPASQGLKLQDGAVVIASITSCTNTSNPALMLGAAVLARNAAQRGLKPAPWVKTSFAPGSKAVTGYIRDAGLTPALDALGFHLVGYGCATCIGNSGPLPQAVGDEIESRGLTVAAVLSGNRNFEARIHSQVRANYLASPPLVVAYALAGRIDIDLSTEPLGRDSSGQPVYLRDIWPDDAEMENLVNTHVTPAQFSSSYASVFEGPEEWRALPVAGGASYAWSDDSTYIKRPPFLDDEFINETGARPKIENARVLGLFGDFITTDHISPAGSIGSSTPAGEYLTSLGVKRENFNSYGARRGNHEVMMRGTFANVRLRNKLVSREGGFTRCFPSNEETTIYDAAMRYRSSNTPLVIIAGREYGSGSSRDWAAKGTRLLGVRAVIAQTYERIHRSNLVGMGVLPLEFQGDESGETLGLTGEETITIEGLETMKPKSTLKVHAESQDGSRKTFEALCRIDTPNELRYFDAGGILPYVLKKLS